MLRDQVIFGILQKLPGQTFALRRMQSLWTPEAEKQFEEELAFLGGKYSVQKIIDGYVWLTGMTIEESKYFREHGDYRYHSFDEVNRNMYADKEKMTLCMLGLSLTEYLWETGLQIHRFFAKEIRAAEGENYLEIGPGHGKYFSEAYNLGRFKKYVAVDISPTAIAMTEEYMQSKKYRGGVFKLACQDATLIDPEKEKYDFVTIQEVLEHLEDPEGMLRKIGELLTENGRAYAMMPICAPSTQHIFLFKNREHVRSIVERAGLEIVKEEYITVNKMTVEAAEEKKMPINTCLIVKRRE